ncbi:MAG: DegT/DnrJ/EryC1/StrS family aminotransferase [Planctomycetes bacterium]|nr:DegT/DnrJ/EryC1/StrS family aminotransferase [Planctomycetota bacterium]MCH9725872.1 DegT/DnrJ/EryC1/StrS family aminotransferase [Planctomycetota bacterium]MCH9777025.1 DegT/DnrJ/EryC1/StrS family aminotransferase [Planctomycetota bacterium]MCH9789746.1 DegT/DnrJ/EryC1/StrS family aminotransferase [Planctomycetota bacterium]MDF1746238.1 DegT/DnrJ/EryC1/StrS family aminotransferase [Gimesia sp.]
MTKNTPTPVPFINLVAQYQRIKAELQETVLRVFDDQAFVLGDEVAEFECDIAEYCDSRNAVGVASGTDALLLALMALEIGPGDEVITSPFTFFATGSSIARVGATPVFADIDPVSMNLCPDSIESKITERTKAIMPVHIFGQCADMEPIWRNAVRNGIPVIEDAAQAIGAEYRGRRAGVLGTIGCFSFFPTKNLGGAGDGGLVTTDDPELATRIRRLRVHGDVGGYQHTEIGINSRLDALQAAVLRVKLKHLDLWTAERQENARRYNALIRHYQLLDCIDPPTVLPDRRHVYNQYSIRVKGGQRDKVLNDLREKHIGCAIYYPRPLHLQQCFQYLGYQAGDLPETELVTNECLALPIFSELHETQQETVIRGIAESLGRLSSSQFPTLYSETPRQSQAA